MSITFTLVGNTSNITADYFPPINLKGKYVCGLVDFTTYNSIPNIDSNNNLFHIDEYVIEIPIGSYELDDLSEFLEFKCKQLNIDLSIKANHNTFKTEILSNRKISFVHERSIGSLLGFSARHLEANQHYISDVPVNISDINKVRLECNIVNGAYINNKESHTIHEFSINVSPGYKIDEVPHNVIYLPVNTTQISSLNIKVVDQSGKLINFRGETISIRLHLKSI